MSLRVALIGGAGHINYVTEGVRALPEARICAVAPGCPEEDPSRLQRAAGGTGVTTYADYRELLATERPDIAAVSPFYHLHAEITCAALLAPPLLRKPLALTPSPRSGAKRGGDTGRPWASC